MEAIGADKIIQEIQKGADSQIEAILQEARQNAGKIREDAARRAEQERQFILARGQQAAEREHQRIVADAKIKVKRKIFDSKEVQINQVFALAEEELKGLAKKPEYQKILSKLIVESGVVAGGGDLEVRVRVDDRKLLSDDLLASINQEISKQVGKPTKIKLSEASLAALGGAVVRSADGAIEADNTIDSRMSRLRSELRFNVAEILFGGGP